MRCAQCGSHSPETASFCAGCGARLEVAPALDPHLVGDESTLEAASASRPAAVGDRSLPRAYTPPHLVERILASRGALEGERKTVTALFCDIVDSTGTAERIGSEAMAGLVEEFLTRSLAEVHRYEGTLTQFLGDGFLALFGAPLAHEDHAHRALLAAWGIMTALHTDPIRLPGDGTLEVRMGLNSGEVVVGQIGDSLRMEYTAIGDTVNLAARLQASADPGAIFLSASTVGAAEGSVEVEPLGQRTVKGRAQPVSVFRLVGVPRPTQARRPAAAGSPLIGRSGQLETLVARIEALGGGQGGLVLVSGEAGVGKSRLIAELRRSPQATAVTWLEGRTLSFGRTIGYWPFLEALRGYCGIADDDGESESFTKLEGRVRDLFGDDAPQVLPYLATLLGLQVTGELAERVRYLDGWAMGSQILLSVRRLFERLAREGPVVLVIEDLHWIDQSSTELIEHLLPLVGEVPLLIVCLSRPDGEGPLEHLCALAERDHAGSLAQIALDPLSPDEGTTLLDALVGHGTLSAREHDLLLGRAEGNPFFLEELVRSLIAIQALTPDPAGGWRASGGLEGITIPDTVQGVITARIDRLEEDVKEVLKVASVVGRIFLGRVVEAVAAADASLDRELEDLLQLELIRERRRIPELEYIFKHALVQEAAYGSILRRHRLELHSRVGECIERLFPDRLDEFSGLLAHHYAQAENWGKAQDYLLKAADEAGRIAADTEALGYYRKALETHAQVFGDRWDPADRAPLERGMGEALFRLGRHDDATEHFLRALALLGARYPRTRHGVRRAFVREIARQAVSRLLPRLALRRATQSESTADDELYRVYTALTWIDYFTDPKRYALDGLLALNLAERKHMSHGVANGSAAFGLTLAHIPLKRVAASYQRRSLAVAAQLKTPIVAAEVHFYHAFGEQLAGNWSSAIDRYSYAESLYWEGGGLRGWGTSAALRSLVLLHRGRFQESLDANEEIQAVATDASDRELMAYALHGRGAILCRRGSFEAALDLLLQALELYDTIPSPFTAVGALADAAMCHLRLGAVADALKAVQESETLVTRHGFRGIHTVNSPFVAGQVHLHVTEHASDPDRATALRAARGAAKLAARRSKVAREGRPGAYRLRGTCEWLRGRRGAARRWWLRSLTEAEVLGARYDLALTELEAGRRLGEPQRLERAASLFHEMEAEWYATQAREALRELRFA